jgi:hypothetical protein
MGAPATHAITRSRPVVDPAAASLAEQASAITQAWASALVGARPLEQIGEVPLTAMALRGPALVAALLGALQSDSAFEELSGAGGAALAELTGAGGPAQATADLEALRGVIWDRLQLALAAAQNRVLADAADRLAAVCAAVLYAALAPPGAVRRAAVADAPAPEAAAVATDGPAVIVDEALPPATALAPPSRRREDPVRAEPAEPHGAEIFVHAAQPGEGPAAWISLVSGQLDRHERDGLPFSVLLAEIVQPVDAAPLAGVSAAAEGVLSRELAAAANAGPAGAVVSRQRPGRWWLLLPEADRPAAEQLSERLSEAARAIQTSEGERVALVLGTASCPQDGTDAATLAAFADVSLYAARAALRHRRGTEQPA